MIPNHPPSSRRIADAIEAKGHTLFKGGDLDLNLFGVRSAEGEPDRFDDWIGALYLIGGRWCCLAFPGTTDPGLYWLRNPMNVRGTAILVPGQYRRSHVVGTHKGYAALRQDRPMRVWRDRDRNGRPDAGGDVHEGVFGINIHRASKIGLSYRVGRWSAGCQVVQDPDHFALLMAIARRSVDIYGPSLTYTLLNEADLDS